MQITADSESIELERIRAMIETFREANPQLWSVSLPSDGSLMPSDVLEAPTRRRPTLIGSCKRSTAASYLESSD